MGARPVLFAVLALATPACGSASADVDAAAQDATLDVGDECALSFLCFDGSSVEQTTCPDAAYYVTIQGDGVTQTLASSSRGLPYAFFFECCGQAAFSVVASENMDGGVSIQFQQPATTNADGGLVFSSGTDIVGYFRADGTGFSSYADASPIVYTHVDPPGGVVAGTYAVDVATSSQPDAATLSLSGTFLVCRTESETCVSCPPKP